MIREHIKHRGPRNIAAIVSDHKNQFGARTKENAPAWDRALMGKSTVISQGVANGVTKIDKNGNVVPAH